MTSTLIICTRNRAESLGRCLAALDPAEIAEQGGEVVVVDNGCTDHTQEVVRTHQRDRFGEALRTVVEPRPGLGIGKNAGIARPLSHPSSVRIDTGSNSAAWSC